jgi:undecaprenyl-diphosphatase
VPTLIAAGGLQLVSSLRDPDAEPVQWGLLVLGLVVSGLTAFVAVRWLLHFVQSHTFEGFGYYRIVLGVAILLLLG